MNTHKYNALCPKVADEQESAIGAALYTGASSKRKGFGNFPEDRQYKKGQPWPKSAGCKKGSLNKSTIRETLYKFFFEATVVVISKDGASRSDPGLKLCLQPVPNVPSKAAVAI